MLKSQHPVPQNVISFGEMVFIEVKKCKMRSFGCSSPIGFVFLRKKGKSGHRYAQRENNVREHREKTSTYKPRERPGKDPFLRGNQYHQHLDFELLTSRTVRQ